MYMCVRTCMKDKLCVGGVSAVSFVVAQHVLIHGLWHLHEGSAMALFDPLLLLYYSLLPVGSNHSKSCPRDSPLPALGFVLIIIIPRFIVRCLGDRYTYIPW